MRREHRETRAAGAAGKLLVEILSHEIDERRQLDCERDALELVSRIDAEGEVVALVRLGKVEDHRRLVTNLIPELDERIDGESLNETVRVGELQAEVVRRVVRVRLAFESGPKRIEREAFCEFESESRDRVDLVPMSVAARRARILAGLIRVNAVPDARGQRDVAEEGAVVVIQVLKDQHERLHDDALVLDVQAARRDVVIGNIDVDERVDFARRLGLDHGLRELFLRRRAGENGAGERARGEKRECGARVVE